MSWITRIYTRTGSTTQYIAADTRPRYPLPSHLTCTPPWAGSIAADYVLSPYGTKETITGLRANTGAYIGNTYNSGKRRLLIAVFDGSDRNRLIIAIAPNMPRQKRKAIASGIAAVRLHTQP